MVINNIKQKAEQHSKLIRFAAKSLAWAVVVSLSLTLGYFDKASFHTIAELFTIIIGYSAFAIVLNTHKISQNSYLTFLGIAFGFISIFEILHTLTFVGINALIVDNAKVDLLLSVVPRLLQGVSILISFRFIARRLSIGWCISAYFLISCLLIAVMILSAGYGFLEGVELTELFRALEITASVIFAAALVVLISNRRHIKFRLYKYMLLSLLASVSADIMLVFGSDMNSMVHVEAHILKFVSSYCIYKAVIQNTLKNPVDSMFYELDMIRNELAEKNLAISRSNEKLRSDIDELHQVERLLRKSKAWSRSIFEGSPVGIALLTTNGVVIEVNPALERILGYSGNEIKNIGISNITHIDDIEKDSRLFDELIESNIDSYNIQKRYIHKDDGIIWANVKMSYIQNVGEDFQFIIAMIEDITQQKENEERQQQLVARLEETNKELDNFAYIVSHDLKAPLRGIGSLANWLVTDYRDKLDKEGADIIDLLINRVERMKNFIEGILQYSRVTRVKENYVDIDLNRLVREVADLLAPPSNIEIEISTALPVIKGERIYIEQIFQNLLSNAVKFMDKPQGWISISCIDAGEHWQFCVADNGAGIDEKYFNKIFMIFQTLQPRDKFESTGIGLSIVKKIVETCGGKIWLESEVKKGTTFYFTLPKHA